MKREELVKALKTVMPAVASKERVEQSSSFIFKAGKISTFNDEIAISYPLDVGVEGAVKAEELYKILGKMKGEELEISEKGGELIFSSGKTQAGMKLEAEIKLPIDSIQTPKKMRPLPKDFTKAVSFCKFSASTDYSNPILTTVHIVDGLAESCNNFRLTQYEMETPGTGNFCLPSAVIDNLVERGPEKMGETEGWLHFLCTDGVMFSCRGVKDAYPDLSKLVNFKGEKIMFPTNVTEILDRVGVMSRSSFSQDEFLAFTLDEGRMEVAAKNEVGWAKESVRIRYAGKKISFMVNTDFMIEACSLLNDIIIGGDKIKLESDKFTHVVLMVA